MTESAETGRRLTPFGIWFARLRWWRASILASLICLTISGADGEDRSKAKPLAITVRDGIVLFDGANLDLEHLRTVLAASGRQDETIAFRVGPNAKSVYIRQVLRAVRDAGFTRIGVIGPLGDAILPPDTTD